MSLMAMSCTKEAPVEESETAILQISPRSSVPGYHIDGIDDTITSFRVMVFPKGMPVRYNKTIDLTNNNPFTLTIEPNLYDFVFIANEDSDTRLQGILSTYSGTVTNIMSEYFESSAFQNDYSIPMTRIIRNVRVAPDNKVYIGGSPTAQPAIWPVEVTRAGIRVDLFMETTDPTVAAASGFSKLEIIRVPSRAYLFDTNETSPHINVTGSTSFETYTATSAPAYRTLAYNKGDVKGSKEEEFAGDVDYTLSEGNLSFAQDGTKYVWYKRIILPYTAFANANTPDYGIKLRATVFGLPYTLTLSNQAEDDYIIPRNSRYKITATLNPDYITFSVSVKNWGANTNVEIPFVL